MVRPWLYHHRCERVGIIDAGTKAIWSVQRLCNALITIVQVVLINENLLSVLFPT